MVGVTKRHVCSVKHCGSRTRSLDPADHTRPLCKEHGGEDADASARLVGLRQGARNVHEEQLHQVAVLAAFVNASAVSTVEKVHGQQTANALFQKVASDPQVLKFLQHDEWTEHARGEANFALNATDLYLRDFLHHTQFSEQLLHLFVTRLHFNADGASKTLFSDYERMFGQPLAEGKTFSRATFLEAALSHNIPSHYPRYKLQLYNNERNRQLSNGTVADTHDTKKYGFQLRVLAGWLDELLRSRAFSKTAAAVMGGTSLDKALRTKLFVNTEWHRMLIGRDVTAVNPEAAARGGFSLTTNTFVGGGAKEVLERCTAPGTDWSARLVAVHESLTPLLFGVDLYCPRRTVSQTEDQLCELRRWETREQKKRGRLRKGGARVVDAQLTRRGRLRKHWRALGFKKKPSPPDYLANAGVVRARALDFR
ncbi:unnamed protein product [Prorocentrum cordatum]|uniref:Phospholipase B-like n=1 Tax=Prorocentrum cordatum TaxID=2364126 RepID=A0ABN9TBE7_9DINO|nr:unnamed protein product [Polarella glacialis]